MLSSRAKRGVSKQVRAHTACTSIRALRALLRTNGAVFIVLALIVGPAQAKLRLVKHIHVHDHGSVDKIIGVETVDHPSDGQLVAYARKYFLTKDQLLGQA